jgi:hypothetical protein
VCCVASINNTKPQPPLNKFNIQATDRKLAPLKRNPSPREQLLDSIRKGRVLKPVAQGLKNRREYFYAHNLLLFFIF